MMSALIYTKFILSVAYIVGFYRHLQFYTAQASYFKINILLFAENCIYVLLAFVSLWTLFEKEALYQKMMRVIGIYAFVSLSLFALYVFKGTLSSVEYWCAILSQIFNILIIGRMYVFKPDENSKKLNKRKVSLGSHIEEAHSSLSFESSFDSETSQKPPEIS